MSRNFRLHKRKTKPQDKINSSNNTVNNKKTGTIHETAFNVTDEKEVFIGEETWIMDNDASLHMTYRLDYFTHFDKNNISTVTLENNQSLTIKDKTFSQRK